MSNLFIKKTNKTPEINFNLEKGILLISGVSVPENAYAFYFPAINWLKEHIKNAASSMEFSCKISYLNTSSLQYLREFFSILEDVSDTKKVLVKWYYEKYDADMQETGDDFKNLYELDFEFIVVEKN